VLVIVLVEVNAIFVESEELKVNAGLVVCVVDNVAH